MAIGKIFTAQHPTPPPGLAAAATRYGIAGLVNTAVTLVIIAGLEAGGINRQLANLSGYAVGLVIAFTLNRRYVFGGEHRAGAAMRFIIAFVIAFIANQAILFVVAATWPSDAWRDAGAQAAGIATYSITMFGLCRRWVFATPRGGDIRQTGNPPR